MKGKEALGLGSDDEHDDDHTVSASVLDWDSPRMKQEVRTHARTNARTHVRR